MFFESIAEKLNKSSSSLDKWCKQINKNLNLKMGYCTYFNGNGKEDCIHFDWIDTTKYEYSYNDFIDVATDYMPDFIIDLINMFDLDFYFEENGGTMKQIRFHLI